VGDSIWARKKDQPRNVALLTHPPSSNAAMIADTTFGIEPYFSLAYEQKVMEGTRLKTVVPLFIKKLQEKGIYSEELIQKVIDNRGSCQGIREIPAEVQRIFKVAHDISWQNHIRMQAAFQKWTDNAITKTINLPAGATPNDIKKAYLYAWKLGCKGLTVYRDKAKSNQVINFGPEEKNCPHCQIPLKRDKKCLKCERCGFSTCEL
jgi:ribonucleoside-diphosphate reductase alpha chain